MKIVMIGAGAMGGSFGGLMKRSGADVTLIDTWQAHVDAIVRDGIKISGALGEHTVNIPAMTQCDERHWADLAIIFTDINATNDAARQAQDLLKPTGFALTMQNGIGNVETLQTHLGVERVVGGSSMCSAAISEPGKPILTHMVNNSIGELDGQTSDRVRAIITLLENAGFKATIDPDIKTQIWSKFILNCCINALCATSGLRLGELARLPEMDALQTRIIDEALELTQAKGIKLRDPDIRATIKDHCWKKFSKPSMLQFVEAGKKTEIDALNNALVREAHALGLAVPYNEALVALLKGRELHQMRKHHEPNLDYDAWEREVLEAMQSA